MARISRAKEWNKLFIFVWLVDRGHEAVVTTVLVSTDSCIAGRLFARNLSIDLCTPSASLQAIAARKESYFESDGHGQGSR